MQTTRPDSLTQLTHRCRVYRVWARPTLQTRSLQQPQQLDDVENKVTRTARRVPALRLEH